MQILTCNTYLNIDMSMNIKPSKTRKEGKEMLRKGWWGQEETSKWEGDYRES